MSNFLYGASVQGIQNFIFETNKLKEIVGASELIEQICTVIFREVVPNYQKENLIMGAAGNIKYVFKKEEDCRNLVKIFPKLIMSKAPGITISQALVKYEGLLDKTHINKLESRLRVQRNKPLVQHNLGLMITERSRRTGKPGIDWQDKVVIDLGQKNKTIYSKEAKNSLLDKILGKGHIFKDHNYPFDIADIVQKKEKEWIAVVHADGNNLGKLLLKMADNLKKEHTKSAFSDFSKRLEKATTLAASEAFYDVIFNKVSDKEKLPIRPVILGGDDLTIIIRGDLAMDYTNSFLKHFEELTRKEFLGFGYLYGLKDFEIALTACAGIAYIKPNYPFHYGIKLAEELTKYSKNIAKNINKEHTPSCISFHKVQSSFIEDYNRIIEQELTANGIHFNYGPYFLQKQVGFATVEQLKYWSREIKREDAPKAPLRNWIGELQVNKARAAQRLKRIKKLNKKYIPKLSLEKEFTKRSQKNEEDYTHIYDVLTLATIEKK